MPSLISLVIKGKTTVFLLLDLSNQFYLAAFFLVWCEDLEEIINLALNKACCWRPTLDGHSLSLHSLLSPSEFVPAPQNLICSVVSFLAIFVSLSHWCI